MSRRTKAELEAENAALRTENKRLEYQNRELIRHRNMLLYMSDEDQKRLKIEGAAHDAEIVERVRLHNKIPKIRKEALSESGSNAAKIRHELPLPTVDALKKDFRIRLREGGPSAKPTTIYKDMAETCIGNRKHWRRIKTQVNK